QPVYPEAFRLTRTAGEAVIDFQVDTSGRVRDAKSVRATHPAFGDSAALAVSGWRFIPGQQNGRVVGVHMQVPVKFDPSVIAQGPAAMKCDVRLITRNAGSNPGVTIALKILTPGPIRPRAGRVVVTKAQGDTGADLTLPTPPDLYATTVGLTSSAEMLASAPRELSFSLGMPSSAAKRLRVVEGYVELVLPDNDPDSTVTVASVLSKITMPIESPTLAEAGISMVVYDKPASDRYRDAKFGGGGPQDYDAGPMFAARQENSVYAKMPPEIVARMTQNFTMKENQLGIGIADRDGHLVGVEFRTKDGQPLRYNHNGSYHSSGLPGYPERRFDTYELPAPIPPDIQMVCWVATKQATVRVPFHFEDLVLP
ncbi:MAG: hypothetical protein JWM35_635, partial [Verrucomicrobia bacterium]|nr:hypothetical protein [Verrucomicrobiota bacterium]